MGEGIPLTADFSLFVHRGTAQWALTSPVPLASAAIVDGLPTRKDTEIVKLLPTAAAGGLSAQLIDLPRAGAGADPAQAPDQTPPPSHRYSGTFSTQDLSPGAGMDVAALQDHIGMGHIFVVADSGAGLIFAPIKEVAPAPAAEEVPGGVAIMQHADDHPVAAGTLPPTQTEGVLPSAAGRR